MSTDIDVGTFHIESVDVDRMVKGNGSFSEKTCDSGFGTTDASSSTFPASSDSEISPAKSSLHLQVDQDDLDNRSNVSSENEQNGSSSLSNPVSSSPDDNNVTDFLNFDQFSLQKNDEDKHFTKDDTTVTKYSTNGATSSIEGQNLVVISAYKQTDLNISNRNLTLSTVSLDEQKSSTNIICKSPHSRSAENISTLSQTDDKTNINSNSKELNTEEVLSQFTSQKNKVSATQKIPDNTSPNLDVRYTRIPKEILSQDIGSIVKNVHGIFSSVSGSLKYAYNQRTTQKPVKSIIKPIPNGKVMNDIFEDEHNETNVATIEKTNEGLDLIVNPNSETINVSPDAVCSEAESDPKRDVFKLQIESLEQLLSEQRKENATLRDRVKQQVDELQGKDQTFKDLESKLDLMSKTVEQSQREKDAAVMRYASVECAGIEAKRAAETAVRAEKAALAEVDLLNNKLKSAHGEKQRICQLYDNKCHELMNSDRELTKIREDQRELEGRLKWTQSKLRIEMDAYKESCERAEKLSQQVSELEAGKEAAAANATDSLKAKQLEAELKENRAALILCRHEKDELEKRLTASTQQLDTCRKERDSATSSLALTTVEVEELKKSNLRLEEEAAELAALRAQAALADALAAQLLRESERATCAEEGLSVERALAETCARREAAALEHAACLTAQHVAQRAAAERHEAEAQALWEHNAALRERVSASETQVARLQAGLAAEAERRASENKVLARKVAELTEEAADARKKLEWEKGENLVLKKKHASAVKELNRELQRALRRCELLEARLPPRDAPGAPGARAGSVSSLSSGGSAPRDGAADTLPDIQVREPDRQTLIERIVSLQRAAARRAERCDFLEEHTKQLTAELRNKSRLLRHMMCSLPAGAVASEARDKNKKELSRLGDSAMAAVWGGAAGGISPQLSLEMNTRLQALLEDTILKNITLKENIDTLGEEISRLKEGKQSPT